MNKKSKLSMNLLLIAFALLPLVISIVVSTIISYSSTKRNLESQTKQSLIVASTGLKEYYENVLAGGNEIEYSHDYTDSLQAEEIELTLFNQDIRFCTSIKDDKGDRIEGTAASEAVWKAVSGGENYYSDDVKINNKPYYVYYMPIYYPNGDLYGMAFAGKTCADVTAAKNSILLSSIISAILLIVAFGVVAVVLARKISVPMNIVAKNVEKIGKGDLSDKDSVKSSIAETEMLISSADVLQNELGKVISETREISDVLVEKIADVSNLINNTSENTEQISNAMNDLADGTMALAGNVQDLNLQVEKLGDCINDINDSVNVLAESSDTIKSSNDVALDYMDKVSGSSERSVQSIDDIAQQIYETNKAIIKIDEAVGLITSVASQTNLLALNASIEAARAGEAGKGFAVVASEIQKLSEESNNGANQIKSIVQDIKKQSDASVHLSDEVKEIIAEEKGYIVETQNKFGLLNNEVTKSLQQISAIKSKTEILMDIKSQIVNNVNDLSAISEENAASNEEVSASLTSIAESVKKIAANGDEMNGCATELQESISYFN